MTELRKTIREYKSLKEEIKKLEDDLQESRKLIESTGIMIIDLKVKIEEARIAEEALNEFLIEKYKDNECLNIEVVPLRKEFQESNMNSSSKILNQIIGC